MNTANTGEEPSAASAPAAAAPATPPADPAVPAPARCRVCQEDIREGALKCTHCSSFQDWRRHFGINETVLALLVAFVSVISMAVPIVKEALKGTNSRVKVSFSDVQDKFLFLVASNSGSNPGSVGQVALAVTGLDAAYGVIRVETGPGDHRYSWGLLPLEIDGWQGETTFIRNGDAKRLRASFGQNASFILTQPSERSGPPPEMRCRLETDVVQFDGTRELQVFEPALGSIAHDSLCNYAWQLVRPYSDHLDLTPNPSLQRTPPG
jgi:hypothetical protein